MRGFMRGLEQGYGLGDKIINQYDEDMLRNDLKAAGTDPEKLAQAYAKAGKADKAMQMRATGLQMKGAERAEKQADLEQRTLALMRRLEAGGDPVALFNEAREVYGQVPDGYSASVTTVNGQPFMVHTNDKQGQSQLVPMTRETVGKALDRLYSMTSMAAFQHAQRLGLETEKAKSADRYHSGMLSVSEQRATTDEQRRKDQERHNKAMERLQRDRIAGLNLTDAQAVTLNEALQFHELAGQYGRSHPDAANSYRNAAVSALSKLPAKVQIQVRGMMMKDRNSVMDEDPLVEVERDTPQGRIKMKVPLSQADPVAYRDAQLRRGAGGFGDVPPKEKSASTSTMFDDADVRAQRIFGPLTPSALLQRAADLGNPAALTELERRSTSSNAGLGYPAP